MKPKTLLFFVWFLSVLGLSPAPGLAADSSMGPHVLANSDAGLLAVFALLALAGFAFWIWMLIDCANSKRLDSNDA